MGADTGGKRQYKFIPHWDKGIQGLSLEVNSRIRTSQDAELEVRTSYNLSKSLSPRGSQLIRRPSGFSGSHSGGEVFILPRLQ